MVFIVRVIHTLFAFFFVFCMGYVYYSALTGHKTKWTLFAVVALVLEGILLLINSGDCPLAPLHRRYGDQKGFFDLFLPPKILPYVIPFFVITTVIGLLLLLV